MIAGVIAGGRPFSGVSGSLPTSGLVAWYKMDSIAGGVLIDETGSHPGTISNATLVGGKLGSAIQCNGSNTLGSIPNDSALNCSAFSISAWVNFTTTGNLVIAEKNGNSGWSLQCISSDIVSGYGGSAGQLTLTSGGTANILRSGVTVNSGTWRHVVATINYAGGVSKMYVDGSLTSPSSGKGSSVQGSPSYISGPLSIGQRPTNIVAFSGAIDNLRYYNRVLSDSEVAALYDET